MKNATLIFCLLFLYNPFGIQAQRNRNQAQLQPSEKAEKAAARMKAQLNLSEEQTLQVKEILLKRNVADKENREAMKKQRDATDKEFAVILSPEQMKKYNQMKAERRNKMMERRKSMHSPRPATSAPLDSTLH
ncbi:MAG TPA: hypothetical protein PLU53_16190 [Bacteroidia bacterium]|nr:hypothetical protein [Bacteroidia bacterium]